MEVAQLDTFLAALPESVGARIVANARQAVGELEQPPGSNRGPWPDAANRASGSPLGSSYCAGSVTKWWKDAGLEVPPADAGACQAWYLWALRTNRFTSEPKQGYAVLYGDGGKPPSHHIGIVAVIGPQGVFDIEANTSIPGYEQTGTSYRDGEIVALKPVNHARLIGYVAPEPLT